jgi:uncharacterized membrane protein
MTAPMPAPTRPSLWTRAAASRRIAGAGPPGAALTQSRPFSLVDHLGPVAVGFEWLVSLIELLAIAILVIGLVRFAAAFAGGEAFRKDASERNHAMNRGRVELGRHILAALEVFIVADLIRTVLELTLDNLLFLAALVLIRSVISFFLERELSNIEREERQQ